MNGPCLDCLTLVVAFVSFLPYGYQRFFSRLRQEAPVSAAESRSGEAMKTSPKSLWHPGFIILNLFRDLRSNGFFFTDL